MVSQSGCIGSDTITPRCLRPRSWSATWTATGGPRCSSTTGCRTRYRPGRCSRRSTVATGRSSGPGGPCTPTPMRSHGVRRTSSPTWMATGRREIGLVLYGGDKQSRVLLLDARGREVARRELPERNHWGWTLNAADLDGDGRDELLVIGRAAPRPRPRLEGDLVASFAGQPAGSADPARVIGPAGRGDRGSGARTGRDGWPPALGRPVTDLGAIPARLDRCGGFHAAAFVGGA